MWVGQEVCILTLDPPRGSSSMYVCFVTYERVGLQIYMTAPTANLLLGTLLPITSKCGYQRPGVYVQGSRSAKTRQMLAGAVDRFRVSWQDGLQSLERCPYHTMDSCVCLLGMDMREKPAQRKIPCVGVTAELRINGARRLGHLEGTIQRTLSRDPKAPVTGEISQGQIINHLSTLPYLSKARYLGSRCHTSYSYVGVKPASPYQYFVPTPRLETIFFRTIVDVLSRSVQLTTNTPLVPLRTPEVFPAFTSKHLSNDRRYVCPAIQLTSQTLKSHAMLASCFERRDLVSISFHMSQVNHSGGPTLALADSPEQDPPSRHRHCLRHHWGKALPIPFPRSCRDDPSSSSILSSIAAPPTHIPVTTTYTSTPYLSARSIIIQQWLRTTLFTSSRPRKRRTAPLEPTTTLLP
ncbi:hypothetical protein ACRALDRAFT_211179 [Sodiomyces alcalophilus JCM 7366]|uniref:uncharacterized protein n=1 Tax=Sodiomyces alcalophilus JCM 7366 TaxID=591952 RepID=UPI0039B6913E